MFPGLTFRESESSTLRKLVELGPMTIPSDAPTDPPTPAGYELFINGIRAGHGPDWTREQGLENLEWNLRNKPGVQVDARFNGKRLSR